MLKSIATMICISGVMSACSTVKPGIHDPVLLALHRFHAINGQDHPFDTGPITVLSGEHGDLHSFMLRPCGGNHICGTRKGHVTKATDYWIVRGAYAGRTFYISAGGDGWLDGPDGRAAIAWN